MIDFQKARNISAALCEIFRTGFYPNRCEIRKIGKGKGKAVPLQAWSGPDGSRNLRSPDFMTTAQDGGTFVILTHRPPLPLGNTTGTHFC
jgi:hypothetical protein